MIWVEIIIYLAEARLHLLRIWWRKHFIYTIYKKFMINFPFHQRVCVSRYLKY